MFTRRGAQLDSVVIAEKEHDLVIRLSSEVARLLFHQLRVEVGA